MLAKAALWKMPTRMTIAAGVQLSASFIVSVLAKVGTINGGLTFGNAGDEPILCVARSHETDYLLVRADVSELGNCARLRKQASRT